MDPFKVRGKDIISSPFNGKFRIFQSQKDGDMYRDKRSVTIRHSNIDYFGVTVTLYQKDGGFDNIQIKADEQGKLLYLVIEELACETIVLITDSGKFLAKMDNGKFSSGVFRLPLKRFNGVGTIRQIYFYNTSIFEHMTEIGFEHDMYMDEKGDLIHLPRLI